MGNLEASYRVDSEADLHRIVEALGERFESDREGFLRSSVYYDTFDWRLWRRGERLVVEPTREGILVSWAQADGRRRQLRLGAEPGLAAELPPGDFRDSLAQAISVRRLLPLAELRSEGHLLRILDRRRKTVVRLVAESRKVRRHRSRGRFKQLASLVRLEPVKGYGRDTRRVAAWLDSIPGLTRGDRSELEEVAAAVGREVGDYASKVVVKLDPELDADEAVRRVLRSLLRTAQANEAGTLQNLDTEFLHQFRVSVRRTRSALGQIKGVFEPASIDKFRREFSWLGKVTGPTRDLDVYLLKLPSYASGLPIEARADLTPLARQLEAMHEEEQGKLVSELSSARYRRLITSWGRFLEQGPEESRRPPRGREPVLRVGAECIASAHRKVLKRGRAIADDTSARALHRLRLDCKKLRYLMEFFRSLFPAKAIERSISALKELQDNLGDFQDYGVQQEMLRRLAREMDQGSRDGPLTLMAIGRLLAELEEGEKRERRRFAESFSHFSSKKTTRRFQDMLKSGGSR